MGIKYIYIYNYNIKYNSENLTGEVAMCPCGSDYIYVYLPVYMYIMKKYMYSISSV